MNRKINLAIIGAVSFVLLGTAVALPLASYISYVDSHKEKPTDPVVPGPSDNPSSNVEIKGRYSELVYEEGVNKVVSGEKLLSKNYEVKGKLADGSLEPIDRKHLSISVSSPLAVLGEKSVVTVSLREEPEKKVEIPSLVTKVVPLNLKQDTDIIGGNVFYIEGKPVIGAWGNLNNHALKEDCGIVYNVISAGDADIDASVLIASENWVKDEADQTKYKVAPISFNSVFDLFVNDEQITVDPKVMLNGSDISSTMTNQFDSNGNPILSSLLNSPVDLGTIPLKKGSNKIYFRLNYKNKNVFGNDVRANFAGLTLEGEGKNQGSKVKALKTGDVLSIPTGIKEENLPYPVIEAEFEDGSKRPLSKEEIDYSYPSNIFYQDVTYPFNIFDMECVYNGDDSLKATQKVSIDPLFEIESKEKTNDNQPIITMKNTVESRNNGYFLINSGNAKDNNGEIVVRAYRKNFAGASLAEDSEANVVLRVFNENGYDGYLGDFITLNYTSKTAKLNKDVNLAGFKLDAAKTYQDFTIDRIPMKKNQTFQDLTFTIKGVEKSVLDKDGKKAQLGIDSLQLKTNFSTDPFVPPVPEVSGKVVNLEVEGNAVNIGDAFNAGKINVYGITDEGKRVLLPQEDYTLTLPTDKNVLYGKNYELSIDYKGNDISDPIKKTFPVNVNNSIIAASDQVTVDKGSYNDLKDGTNTIGIKRLYQGDASSPSKLTVKLNSAVKKNVTLKLKITTNGFTVYKDEKTGKDMLTINDTKLSDIISSLTVNGTSLNLTDDMVVKGSGVSTEKVSQDWYGNDTDAVVVPSLKNTEIVLSNVSLNEGENTFIFTQNYAHQDSFGKAPYLYFGEISVE